MGNVFSTMKIRKTGEASPKDVVWWRTRDTRNLLSNLPAFQDLSDRSAAYFLLSTLNSFLQLLKKSKSVKKAFVQQQFDFLRPIFINQQYHARFCHIKILVVGYIVYGKRFHFFENLLFGQLRINTWSRGTFFQMARTERRPLAKTNFIKQTTLTAIKISTSNSFQYVNQ